MSSTSIAGLWWVRFDRQLSTLARPALFCPVGSLWWIGESGTGGQSRAMSSSKPDSIVIAESSSSFRSAARSVSDIVRAVSAIGDAHHVCLFFVHPG